jgi:hypothetical protein
MPKYWVWANWINPLKYGIESTIMNEFIGMCFNYEYEHLRVILCMFHSFA